MAQLDDLMTAIANRITNAQAAGGSAASMAGALVVTEDAHDLKTEIEKAIANIGMCILIGQPTFDQTATEFSPNATLKITTGVAIGEVPIIWRTVATRPKAQNVAVILTQLLHGMKIDGFVNLRVTRSTFVPNPKRQLFELTIETSMVAPPLA